MVTHTRLEILSHPIVLLTLPGRDLINPSFSSNDFHNVYMNVVTMEKLDRRSESSAEAAKQEDIPESRPPPKKRRRVVISCSTCGNRMIEFVVVRNALTGEEWLCPPPRLSALPSHQPSSYRLNLG